MIIYSGFCGYGYFLQKYDNEVKQQKYQELQETFIKPNTHLCWKYIHYTIHIIIRYNSFAHLLTIIEITDLKLFKRATVQVQISIKLKKRPC